MIDANLLKSDERAIYTLRALYKKYGYMPYKMSKFEEYDLYVQNKDFLVSDRVITFNDTNGTLMALKPDVSLSIIKNAEDAEGAKTKVYYNENVYRVSDSTHQFKEIMQTGLECIGDIGDWDIFETVHLAVLSLASISENFVLDISHLDIIESVLDSISDDEFFRAEIIECIGKKSLHDIERACAKFGISEKNAEVLTAITRIYGRMDDAIKVLEPLCRDEKAKEALGQLCGIWELIKDTDYADRVHVDFSITGNMNYYSGIVFSGFIDGIFTKVLSGGRYDKLVRRMGKNAGAVGFALYLDLLEGMAEDKSEYDVDVLILCGKDTEVKEIAKTVEALTKDGKSVSVGKRIPEKLRYREAVKLGGWEDAE
jgi:ATP phosphoribosyltransferase regulatory subunit